MYCYCIEKSEIKKRPLITLAPTLKIFGFVPRFLYSGGWQVWLYFIWHLPYWSLIQIGSHFVTPSELVLWL